MNFHILAKKNLGPGVAYNKFTTVRPRVIANDILSPFFIQIPSATCENKIGPTNGPKRHAGLDEKVDHRLREFIRQFEAEVVGNSRSKIDYF